MKTCIKCEEHKTLDEFQKHKSCKDGHRNVCRKCINFQKAERYKINPGRAVARAAEWYRDNQARAAKANAEYQKNNKVRLAELAAIWKKENREKVKALAAQYRLRKAQQLRERSAAYRENNLEKCRLAIRTWAKNNPHKVNSKTARRFAAKLQATPAWAEDFLIEEAYHLAALRTRVMGFDWHVDHIVPLQGKTVCGLHVHTNLQVIPGLENLSKNNRYWPDMPVAHREQPLC